MPYFAYFERAILHLEWLVESMRNLFFSPTKIEQLYIFWFNLTKNVPYNIHFVFKRIDMKITPNRFVFLVIETISTPCCYDPRSRPGAESFIDFEFLRKLNYFIVFGFFRIFWLFLFIHLVHLFNFFYLKGAFKKYVRSNLQIYDPLPLVRSCSFLNANFDFYPSLKKKVGKT